jgi:hypothetical protein
VCHQTVSLVARHLEANGIPTMCIGSAIDILEAGRPPRAVFLDYPLGHTAGKAFDEADQDGIVLAALRGLETFTSPGQLETLPNRWDADGAWQQAAASSDGGDTRQARDETPQFQSAGDRDAAIASGALTP